MAALNHLWFSMKEKKKKKKDHKKLIAGQRFSRRGR